MIAIDVDDVPLATANKLPRFRRGGVVAADFREIDPKVTVIMQHVLVVIYALLVAADRVARRGKWRHAAHLAIEAKMPAQQFPERDCLSAIDPDFQCPGGAEFLKEQEPHCVKGVLAEAALI
jgi:hypothetical protein